MQEYNDHDVRNILYDEVTVKDYKKYDILNMGYYEIDISLQEFYVTYYQFEEYLKENQLGIKLIIEKIKKGKFEYYKLLIYTHDIEDLKNIVQIGKNIKLILNTNIDLYYQTVKRLNGEKMKLVLINDELKINK